MDNPDHASANDDRHPLLPSGGNVSLVRAFAGAQVACLPPEEPYPYEPSDLDDELRQIVNEQYETYVRKIEDYINCLETERAEAMRSAQKVVQNWVRYFGDEAALRYDARPDEVSPPDHLTN